MKKADLYGITIEEDGEKFNIVYSGENGKATLASCWDYLLAEDIRDTVERYLETESNVISKEISTELDDDETKMNESSVEKYAKNLADLTMTPAMWKELDAELNGSGNEWSKEYHDLVMDYQRREEERRPTCNTDFGTCRYCGKGFKCGYSGSCRRQKPRFSETWRTLSA